MTKKEVTQLAYEITGFAIKVHKALGPGLLESIYEKCLKYEVERNGYDVKQQLSVKIDYYDLERPQGLLINFNTTNITKSMKPLVNDHFARLID
jgi:hypothetical protein